MTWVLTYVGIISFSNGNPICSGNKVTPCLSPLWMGPVMYCIWVSFREDSQIDFGTPNVNLTYGIHPPPPLLNVRSIFLQIFGEY